MKSNLIPTPVVDKNGKQTTVHKKSVPSGATRMIPSPATSIAAQSPYQPTEDQYARMSYLVYQVKSLTDPDLANTIFPLEASDDFHNLAYEANDVEVYGVASVTSIGNANALLAHGIRGKEEAVEFLTENGLERLILDNYTLPDAAMRAGVLSKHLLELLNKYDVQGCSVESILEATDIQRRNAFAAIDIDPPIAHQVLLGYVSGEDVKTIGAGILSDHNDTFYILKKLAAIKRGDSVYDAVQLREYIDATRTEIGYAAAIKMADRFGMDRVLTIRDKLIAFQNIENIELVCKVPAESVYDVTMYHDRFRSVASTARRTEIQDVVRLYYAGVEPELAMNLRNKDMSVDMIIEAHQQGIHGAVAEGWI